MLLSFKVVPRLWINKYLFLNTVLLCNTLRYSRTRNGLQYDHNKRFNWKKYIIVNKQKYSNDYSWSFFETLIFI